MKILLSAFSAVILCLSGYFACAEQLKVLVAPVDVNTSYSSHTIYPHISNLISNDIVNELNKDPRFNVPDPNSAENLLMSQGLYEKYRNFLKTYKDNGTIDYKLCGLLNQRLGIDKILLVSSGFSLQNMVLKRPLLYKLGLTEFEPVQSFYQLNADLVLIDTQTCIVDYENTYEKLLRSKNFEIPTNSMNDNIVSSEKIKKFSRKISKDIALKAFADTSQSVYSKINSNTVSTTNVKIETREGQMTRDGHSYSTNNSFLKNKRIESFKNWVKEKADL